MNLTRRKFLIGAAGLIAAPAIVKYANIMPVRVVEEILHYDVATLYAKKRVWWADGFEWEEVKKQIVNPEDHSIDFYLPNSYEDFKMVDHKTGESLLLVQSTGVTGTASAQGPGISWAPGVDAKLGNEWNISRYNAGGMLQDGDCILT